MEKIINYLNIDKFAYVNDKIIKKPIKGIVVSFFSLNSKEMFDTDTLEGEYYAEKGILFVMPYNNPWAWMNRQAVSFTDEILDVLIKEHNISDSIPICTCGGSMGGQSALVYTAYAKRTPVLCVANCPVCDVLYHYSERKDLPRTLYSALFNEKVSFEEALKSISAFYLAEKMPKISYRIFHCDADMSVNIKVHSERFVEKMKELGHDITLDVVPDRGHGKLTYSMWSKFVEYIVKTIETR